MRHGKYKRLDVTGETLSFKKDVIGASLRLAAEAIKELSYIAIKHLSGRDADEEKEREYRSHDRDNASRK